MATLQVPYNPIVEHNFQEPTEYEWCRRYHDYKTQVAASRVTIIPATHREKLALMRLVMWLTLKLKNYLGGLSTNLRGIVILKMTAGRMC